ncbi:Fic family protein [Thomasclavelia spiroformis]|uniref:Fic family protein n=1 Tax=Thomasclavelia spiroformis TaxID=29348 RepID=UPI0035634C6D
MKYIQLKKMFHIDENKCNELYFKRFNSETTNHLEIKLNNDYECFYLINDEILSLLDKIYMLNTWLEKTMASDALPNLAKEYLIISTLVEEIRSSNQMEGIYSTRKELKDMLINNTPKNYKRFSGMINKYEKLRKEQFLKLNSVSDIRALYDEILLEDVINEDEKDKPDGVIFRKGSVEISSETKVIHQGIVGENNIIDMIEKSLKILNNENINFLIRIAVFHYLFEYIHPFYDGNVPLRYQQQIAA